MKLKKEHDMQEVTIRAFDWGTEEFAEVIENVKEIALKYNDLQFEVSERKTFQD